MGYVVHQPAVPNAEDKWSAAEHLGNLLLFFPTEVRRQIKTSNGDADAVACARVVNLDTGRVLHDTLIFGTALVPNIGPGAPDGVVAGRLAQGEGKPGQSKPWILLPHDEQELQRVQAWLALDAQNAVQQPQGPPTPAASAPQANWGGPAPVASPAPATGGWGGPAAAPPQAAGWGAPAPAAASPAPQAGGWGSPAPVAPQPPTFEELVAQGGPPAVLEALRKKGVPGDQVTSPEQAAQIWALVRNNPDVA